MQQGLLTQSNNVFLRTQLLPQNLSQRHAILGELLNTLMELIKRHRILEKFPAELGFIVNIRHFGDRISFSGSGSI